MVTPDIGLRVRLRVIATWGDREILSVWGDRAPASMAARHAEYFLSWHGAMGEKMVREWLSKLADEA